MSSPTHVAFVPLAIMMFASGLGIPVLAALNAALGNQLGSPVAATLVLFGVGLVLCAMIAAVTGLPPRAAVTFEHPQYYFGAAFMLFYALAVTFAAPRIGVGNAIFFVLLGQLVAAAAIDHFGLWGAMKSAISAKRVLGIAVMALGVYLARKPI